MKNISRDELKGILENGGVTIVEALSERSWKDGHLPGAVQLDYPEVRERAGDVLPDKDAKIVVYCANEVCRNSVKAAEELEALGYTNVYEYAGGKQDWVEAGLALER
ncbi:MAG TPA: rhodanese-like domain-containing protein [Thermodesulfobacteriota bacterium]|nr:rhodanese-like domain-containing protein [Thermodesulfobacteriota bacterium]